MSQANPLPNLKVSDLDLKIKATLEEYCNHKNIVYSSGSLSQSNYGNVNLFVPDFTTSGGRYNNVPMRRSQQGAGKRDKPPPIHESLSLNDNVQLHQSEQAWKPDRLTHVRMSDEDRETRELNKAFTGILNKLTPRKFETLVGKIQTLSINTLPRLQGVIELIYQKAINEPRFCKTYAQLCYAMQSTFGDFTDLDNPEKTLNFRIILINNCQRLFEKNKADELKAIKREAEINSVTDLEKKKELQLLFEDEERRIRRKSVGNYRFIGELFKLGMLTHKIMIRCIQQLLSQIDEESLECLCTLLTITGKLLEEKSGSAELDHYFKNMKDLSEKKNPKISSRIRFMLLDVIDLRNNRWVPRRDENLLKTIDQIDQEFEQTQYNERMNASLMQLPKRTQQQDDRYMVNRKGIRTGGSRSIDESGWQTVQGKQNFSKPTGFTVDATKFQHIATDSHTNDVLSSATTFTKWGIGSARSKSRDTSRIGSNSMYGADNFALLSGTAKAQFNRPVPTSNSLERSSFNSNRESTEPERHIRNSGGGNYAHNTQASSRESSKIRLMSQANPLPNLKESDLDLKIKATLEEYCNHKNIVYSSGSLSQSNYGNVNLFVPDFTTSGGRYNNVPMRRSQQGAGKRDKPPPIHESLSLNDNVQLHQSEQAWKPDRLTHVRMSDEDRETRELNKAFTGILNKLTPRKFETLVGKIQTLSINTLPRLQGVIELIYQKAINEPRFCKTYAQLCYAMQSTFGDFTDLDNPEKTLNFRIILINNCQRLFEKNKADELKAVKREAEINSVTDLEKKKELQLLFEDEERRIRRKSVGNYRFIGELFKLGMLTHKIMIRCIQQLLSQIDEESLECLCTLLTTTGKLLEEKSGSAELDHYFKNMKDLSEKKNPKISSRIRFMLLDVIDLRNNRWVPRRDENLLKTIDQIDQEFEQTQYNERMNASLMQLPKRTQQQDDRYMVNRKGIRTGGSRSIDESGWQMVQGKQNFSKPTGFTVDATKFQHIATDSHTNDVLSSATTFTKWGIGSARSKSRDTSRIGSNSMYGADNFALLSGTAKAQFNRPVPTSNSLERSSFNSNRESTEPERHIRNSGGGNYAHNAQAYSRESSKIRLMSQANPLPNLKESDLDLKIKATLEEYCNHKNIVYSSGSLSQSNYGNVNLFVPDFTTSGGRYNNVPMRRSQQGAGKRDKPPPIHESLSLNDNVQLHQSEQAWKPDRLTHVRMSDEDRETRELNKAFTGILNKLTPRKFETLVGKIQTLSINTLPRLQGVIELIYQKAINEPRFCKTYAQLCYAMQSTFGDFTDLDNPEKTLNFRIILINNCQRLFEKNKADELKAVKREAEINSVTDLEKKKELQLLFEDEERRIRRKSVGNYRFIGELFKLGMLTHKIMIRCIQQLLSQIDEESLECLCTLLTTTGKLLEEKSGSAELDHYFKNMKDLSEKKNPKISSRIRFMLLDVIDLRNNRWVPRRDENLLKTIDQIDQEFEQTQYNERMNASLMQLPKRTQQQDDRYMVNRKGIRTKPERHIRNSGSGNYAHNTQASSRESSKIRPKTQTNPLPNLKESDLDLKIKATLEEYCNHKNIIETISFLRQWLHSSYKPKFVSSLFQYTMDKSDKFRSELGHLLGELVFKDVLTSSDIIDVLSDYIVMWSDMLVDYPNYWAYLAEIMVPMIAQGIITFEDIRRAAERIYHTPECGHYIWNMLDKAQQLMGTELVRLKWNTCDLKLTHFIKPENELEFINKHGLQYLLTHNTNRNENDRESEFKAIITKFIAMNNSEEILDYIKDRINDETRRIFIQALPVILEIDYQQSGSCRKLYRVYRNNIRYLIDNHEESLEVLCLTSISHLMNKLEFPKGLLLMMFEYLWDDHVISTEGFEKWRDIPNDNKGVCMKQLATFYEYIRENAKSPN